MTRSITSSQSSEATVADTWTDTATPSPHIEPCEGGLDETSPTPPSFCPTPGWGEGIGDTSAVSVYADSASPDRDHARGLSAPTPRGAYSPCAAALPAADEDTSMESDCSENPGYSDTDHIRAGNFTLYLPKSLRTDNFGTLGHFRSNERPGVKRLELLKSEAVCLSTKQLWGSVNCMVDECEEDGRLYILRTDGLADTIAFSCHTHLSGSREKRNQWTEITEFGQGELVRVEQRWQLCNTPAEV